SYVWCNSCLYGSYCINSWYGYSNSRFAISVAQNGTRALIAAAGCIVVSILGAFIGHAIFKNTKIKTAAEIRGTQQDDLIA
ncbi:hypothetical protein JWF52_16655, partial [Clostridium sp. CCUG 7971]|nr:hypothetical protein [Clostridium sp. CCUG 7971]